MPLCEKEEYNKYQKAGIKGEFYGDYRKTDRDLNRRYVQRARVLVPFFPDERGGCFGYHRGHGSQGISQQDRDACSRRCNGGIGKCWGF